MGVGGVSGGRGVRDDAQRPAAGLALLTPDELVALPEPDWLVEPYAPSRGLVWLFGPPSTYKSFLAIWLMGEAGGGVYFCAEGAPHMIGKRIKAWETVAERPSRILVHPYGPNLLDPDAVTAAIAAIRQAGHPCPMVVIDTIARHTPGADENAGKDMGRFIAHCDRLGSDLGCVVVGIGHTGHGNQHRLRGWSGQYAATDVEISIERDGDLRARLRCSKPPRDGEAFDPRVATLQPCAGSLVVAQVVTSEAAIEAAVREYLDAHPDASQREVEKNITGKAATIRAAYRKCVPASPASQRGDAPTAEVRPASPLVKGTRTSSPADAVDPDDPENPVTLRMWERLADVLNLRTANGQMTLEEAGAVWEQAEHLDGPALERLAGDLEVGE